MWRKLWRILQPFHRTFAVFAALSLVYATMELVGSYMPSLVVQLNDWHASGYVWALVILGKYVFDDVYMRLDNAVDWHIVTKHSLPIYRFVKTMVMRKLLRLDPAWFQARDSGEVLNQINYGVQKLDDIVNSLSWEFVPRTIQGVVSLVPLVVFSPFSVLVVLVATTVFVQLTLVSNNKRAGVKTTRYNLYDRMGQQEVESIQNIAAVAEHLQAGRLLAEYENSHRKQERLARGDFHASNVFNRFRLWTLNIARFVLVPVWVFQLTHGGLTVPQMVYIWGLADKLFDTCWKYVNLLDRVFDAREPIKRVMALLEEESPILRRGTVRGSLYPLDIVVSGVCFSYSGDYKPESGTIHDLDLEVASGSMVGLVGTSGSGKTTLYQLLMGMRYPQSGSIYVGGVEVREWCHRSLLHHIGHMFSGDTISTFSASIAENIAFGRPEATLEDIVWAATLAGLHGFVRGLPRGYDTLVGERGVLLSAGQKQRMEFARVLLPRRDILLLDEPTSAVDAETEEVMQRAIQSVRGRCTIIVSAHRLATVVKADNIVVLEDGRKVEEGTHQDLVSLGGSYARMWAKQIGKSDE